jgi:hypothetical protein
MRASTPQQPASAVVIAMTCAAASTAQFIAGKATRDALFLQQFNVTSLPAMVVATSVVSIGLVILSSKCLRRVAPTTFVPLAFAVSALLLMAEWAVSAAPRRRRHSPRSPVGPILGPILARRKRAVDPARQAPLDIAGAGTAGGLFGRHAAERGPRFLTRRDSPMLACLSVLVVASGSRHPSLRPAASSEPSPELSAAPGAVGSGCF